MDQGKKRGVYGIGTFSRRNLGDVDTFARWIFGELPRFIQTVRVSHVGSINSEKLESRNTFPW